MKTVKEWLEELPEPYKTQAIQNTLDQNKEVLTMEAQSLHSAISCAFHWSKSFEGFEYWNNFIVAL